MDCSIPLKRLLLETKLQKMIDKNVPDFKLKPIREKIDKLATMQQIAMIEYAASHKKEEKKAS